MKYIIILLTSLILKEDVFADDLNRKAWIGILAIEKNNQVVVDSVIPSSTSFHLGLKKNDTLKSINQLDIHSIKEFNAIVNGIYQNEKIDIHFKRNTKLEIVSGLTVSKPLFKPNWCNIVYQSLMVSDCKLRTMIYKPIKKMKSAAILFIPGYNCGSIESFSSNFNGRLIEHWVQNGYTVYTIEKSGVGDSYGCKSCYDVDLENDIQIYTAALNDLSNLSYVDKENIFIWGHSMGGIIAPIIAQNKSIKGIMVFGTVFRPWSEFLLEMHRVQKPLTDNLSYAETENFVRLIQKVYYEFFILKKSPTELYQTNEYKNIVESELEYKIGKDEMWGRHWRFWQQLDSINLASSWQNVNCKVLVLHGQSDYIQCSSVEPYLITETINKVHPNHAQTIIMDSIDHLMMNSKNFEEAVSNFNSRAYNKGNFNMRIVHETLAWLHEVNQE